MIKQTDCCLRKKSKSLALQIASAGLTAHSSATTRGALRSSCATITGHTMRGSQEEVQG